jgi:FkbM family methyltransferase
MATLLTLFERGGDDLVFFDVGANMGLYALMCASMFEPEAVHAFEPTPSTAEVARRAVGANKLDITVEALALGDRSGSAELYFSPTSDETNSLVDGFKSGQQTVTVPVRRMDDHVAMTGVHPTVIKIDVETHEPAVLAGAIETIARDRPAMVIEVLHRRGRDHGIEITSAMAGQGYSYYPLGEPGWTACAAVKGVRGGGCQDWLLSPTPLDSDFGERWNTWADQLARCGPERNSRVPLGRTALAALRRGGPAEVASAARRYVAAVRRGHRHN